MKDRIIKVYYSTNNPYVKYGNKYSFNDEEVDYDKE